MAKVPLEGIRVCDLTTFWSGAYCTAYLGGMGAEVIKVESVQRPDGFRFGTAVFDRWWESFGSWVSANINKYDVTLDLTRPRGIELLKELMKVSDIVIDNYSPRVMEAFGLTYPVIRQLKPDIITVSMPAYGASGPWKHFAGFAFPFEQAAGVAYVTGYRDGPPLHVGAADPIAGMHAAFAVQVALEHRRATGEGQYIDVSQTEAAACLTGQAVADWSMNRRVWGRSGNRDSHMAPHGIYRCKGDDKWVALAVSSDGKWKSFCHAIGNPQWTADEKFGTAIGRWENQDELDGLVESWTMQHDNVQAEAMLQSEGVAAGAVIINHDAPDHPQYKATGFFQQLTRDVVGAQPYPRWPVKFSETPVAMRRAPTLGEDNGFVLGSVLGLTPADIKELEQQQIIGTVPVATSSLGV